MLGGLAVNGMIPESLNLGRYHLSLVLVSLSSGLWLRILLYMRSFALLFPQAVWRSIELYGGPGSHLGLTYLGDSLMDLLRMEALTLWLQWFQVRKVQSGGREAHRGQRVVWLVGCQTQIKNVH